MIHLLPWHVDDFIYGLLAVGFMGVKIFVTALLLAGKDLVKDVLNHIQGREERKWENKIVTTRSSEKE